MSDVEPRIVFMGTPEFALPTLERLIEQYGVVGVITQPDRPAGRGRQLTASPVKEVAVAEGIPVRQPGRVRRPEALEALEAWAPDVVIVAAYGQILPESLLEVPAYGVLNVHASLLPRWRGASPIQGTLLAGDEVTGVTIMKMDPGMDTGPILAKRETPVGPDETAGELEARLALLGADLLMQVLPGYLSGDVVPEPQPEDGITLTRPRRRSQPEIDWALPARQVHNHVRAFSPDPGAFTFWESTRIKILRTETVDGAEAGSGEPGTVFMWKRRPAVVTGDGCLALAQLQMAGKRPMDGGAFVRGRQEFVGATLGSREPGE
jgi:methionyl-tRNA formyltransferase